MRWSPLPCRKEYNITCVKQFKESTVVENKKDLTIYKVGQVFFRWRGRSPFILVLLMIYFGRPDILSLAVGAVLAVGGEVIRYWGMRHIGGAARTRNPERVDDFIVSGPYRYVRNPLYVGNFFTGLGVAVMCARWELIAVYVVMFFVQYIPIVRMEEINIELKFKEVFVKYMEQVPPWFPRVPSVLPPVDREQVPHLMVLKNERSTLLGIAAMILCFGLLYKYQFNLLLKDLLR
ncbi:MAG TPA: hypothetical protein DCZ92_10380 [Elusimicrobia bacterium]|nr:hypothetical protein [Elusimicrobiota bacterium]